MRLLAKSQVSWSDWRFALVFLLLLGGCDSSGTSGLNASFTAAPMAGGAPLTVAFTDGSSAGVTSWSWDFGDGLTSIEKDPVHVYDQDGVYTVSLTVSDGARSNTRARTDLILVGEPPRADFEASPLNGPAILSVQFTDRSQGSITSWQWDFGDGGTSPAQNPDHSYASAGTYTVRLRVSGPRGSDELVRAGLIRVEPGTDGLVSIERTEVDLSGDMSHPQVLVAEDGDHWVACRRGDSNTVLFAYDARGELRWQREFVPQLAGQGNYRFVQAPDDRLWLLGDPRQSFTLSAALLDRDGRVEWQSSYGYVGAWQDHSPDSPPQSRILFQDVQFGEVDLQGRLLNRLVSSVYSRELRLGDGDSLLFDPVNNGPAVARLASDRTVRWEGALLDVELERALECRDGGSLLVGEEGGDLLLAKVDAGGSVLWQRIFEPSINQGTSCLGVAGDRSSGYHLLFFGLRGGGVLRTDPDGDVLWNVEIDAPAATIPYGIVGQPGGGCLLYGSSTQEQPAGQSVGWALALDADGEVQREVLLSGCVLVLESFATSDGGYLVSGTSGQFGNTSLAKLDAGGSLIWRREWSASLPADFVRLSDGRFVYAAVRQTGPLASNLVLAELDSGGGILWNRELPYTSVPVYLGAAGFAVAPQGADGLLIASIAFRDQETQLVLLRTVRGRTGGSACDDQSIFSEGRSFLEGRSTTRQSAEVTRAIAWFPFSTLQPAGGVDPSAISDFPGTAREHAGCGP